MRKNILRTFIAAVLFCAILTIPAWAESAVITGSGVNVRSGPGTNYRVVDCLDKGTAVTVNDRSNASWYSVTYNGVTGFVSSSYLRLGETTTTTPITSSSGSAYINAMYVRFRSGAGSNYSILGEYNTGKAVTVTGTSGSWTQCTIDGKSGYIYSSYITNGSYSGGYSGGGTTGTNPYSGSYTEIIIPTAAPVTTATPIVTAAPVVTDAPIVTAAPAVTDAPIVTAAPAVTDAPVVTATPTTAPTAAPVTAKTGYINGNYVRFRTGPGTGYSIIESYNTGKALTITGVSGSWTQCTIDGKSGYVFSQYVKENAAATPTTAPTTAPTAAPTSKPSGTGESNQKQGYITGNNVRFRSAPSMSSEVLGEFYYGNTVVITGVSGDWTAVTYNGKAGYVYSSYVKEGVYQYTTPNSTPAPTTVNPSGTATGSDVANFALTLKGSNYTWGGASPATGFDCSGLVYYCYGQYGYTLHRVAADQATDGVAVAATDLKPGDILCFYSGSGYIGHAGIYLGDDLFIHAANSTSGVIVTQLSGWYTERGFEARRIIS